MREARIWLNKLLEYNKEVKKHDPDIFEKVAVKKWHHLFFLLVPYGFKTVWTYFYVTGISHKHFNYYFKYSVNKFIGRK